MRRAPKVHTRPQAPSPKKDFELPDFLSEAGVRKLAHYPERGIVFAQGDRADSIFYICSGSVQLAAVSKAGPEAIIEVLGAGDLIGEGCLAGQTKRTVTATALTECSIIQLARKAVGQLIPKVPQFSEWLISQLIARRIRLEKALLELL